jgi:methionyl-tRNA formyltransferase
LESRTRPLKYRRKLMIKSLLFTAKKVSRQCLEVVCGQSEILAVIQEGPDLKSLDFIVDPKDYFAGKSIPFFTHKDLRDVKLKKILQETDTIISIGYGRILPKSIFTIPPFGAINLHPAYLPEYRGKHPDIYAIMNGDAEVGITLHFIDTGVDTGDIISQRKVPIGESDSIVTMTYKLYLEGAELVADALVWLNENKTSLRARPQREVANSSLSTRIDWEDSAKRIHNLVRSLTYPWPMAYTFCREQKIYITSTEKIETGVVSHPGLIRAIQSEGVIVAAGVHELLIKEIRLGNGNHVISKEEIAAVLCINEGDLLG